MLKMMWPSKTFRELLVEPGVVDSAPPLAYISRVFFRGGIVSSPDPTYEREGLVTSGRYLGLH